MHVEIVTISIETMDDLKNKLNSNHAGTVLHDVYYLLLWLFLFLITGLEQFY